MAQYPSIRYSVRSKIVPMDGLTTARSTNGNLRGRQMWDEQKVKLTMDHPALTRDEIQVLKDHYQAHRLAPFIVDFDGQTYSVIYVMPLTTTPIGAGLWDVVAELEEE